MSRMGRQDTKEDSILIKVVDKVYSDMGSVAIKDQELIGSSGLPLCTVIKHLFKPDKSNIVVCPARK